jgi:exopolysaccharide production protein ExoZ
MPGTLNPSAASAGGRASSERHAVAPANRILPMDGLRGIAVTLVFFVHYATLAQGTPGFGRALAEAGHHGVELFFVLSGYLIYRAAMSPRLEFGRFLLRRAHRLYPTFLAVFALYVGLSFVFPAESKIPADPVEAATYLAANLALLPGLFPIAPMITVAWSLSYEVAYYLACPALCLLLGLRRWPVGWRVAFWLLVAVSSFAFADRDYLRAALFVSGILVYEARDLRVPGRLAALLALLVLLAAATGLLVGPAKLAALFVSIGLLCVAAFEGGPIATPLSWAPLRWLGEASYSYYLIHGLVLKAIATVMPMPYWPMLVPAFAATLAGAAVLHYAVERPFSLGVPKSRKPIAAAARQTVARSRAA